MTSATAIPGADELIGKGVYFRLPEPVPPPVRDCHAVVTGDPVECAAAARRLGAAGWKVTIVTRASGCGCGMRREWRRRAGAAVVCASGVAYLEAVVLLRTASGRLEACNASALFLLCRGHALQSA